MVRRAGTAVAVAVLCTLEVAAVPATPAGAATVPGEGAIELTAERGVRAESMSAGNQHACAVQVGGTLRCWGSNFFGQRNAPAQSYMAVAAGAEHTCAVRVRGRVDCWGRNNAGQATSPASTIIFTALSAGGAHTCGILAAGTVDCWGDNTYGQASDQTATTYRAVTAGGNHTCAITVAGAVDCWGDNTYGQATDQAGPFRSISAGANHTCGILAAGGTLDCWGDDTAGQATDQATVYRSIDAGVTNTCGVNLDSTITCWGNNSAGQSAPPAVGATSIITGSDFACAATLDGPLTCWGANSAGQTTPPTGTFRWVAVALSQNGTCVLAVDGTIDCWGDSLYGQLDVPDGQFLQIVRDDSDTACALAASGAADCWGRWAEDRPGPYLSLAVFQSTACGLLPSGDADCWSPFTGESVADHTGPFVSLIRVAGRTCGLEPDGGVECWLDNDPNGLDYTAEDRPVATYVSLSRMVGSADEVCAVTSVSTVDCWNRDSSATPFPPVTPATTFAITAWTDTHSSGAYRKACSIRAIDAALDCGNLADWPLNDYANPPPVETGVVALASVREGATAVCAVRLSGLVACWGSVGAHRTFAPTHGTTAPPPAGIGLPYAHQLPLQPWGPVPATPSQFSLVSGSLPPGLALGADGSISGTPTVGGSFPVTVRASNVAGSADRALTLVVTEAPTVATISDRSIVEGTATGPIDVMISDPDDAADDLVVTATSSDTAVVPDTGIALSGTGALRSLQVTPNPDAVGDTDITVTVTDPIGLSASTTFTLTVVPYGGSIQGQIVEDGTGTPLANVRVVLYAGTTRIRDVWTGPDGRYLIDRVAPGTDYRLRWRPDASTHVDEYHEDALTIAQAIPLTVGTGPVTADGDVTSRAGLGDLGGTVTSTVDGTPVAGLTVRLYRNGIRAKTVVTNASGTWAATNLDVAATWTVYYRDETGTWVNEWHDNSPSSAGADPVALTALSSTTVNAQLVPQGWLGTLAGTVTDPGATPLTGIQVKVLDGATTIGVTTTGPTGTYQIPSLPPGTYTVRFKDPTGAHQLRFWPNATSQATATPITITSSATTTADATLPPT